MNLNELISKIDSGVVYNVVTKEGGLLLREAVENCLEFDVVNIKLDGNTLLITIDF